ncbi:MAG: TRAP transporter small permease [Hyphomicrobiaceae bacterium]|nr:MAG: TRAP transporter small permease [Hyphomicrobiaceae bacterium]
MTESSAINGTRPYGLVRRLIELWALAGGLLLVALVLMNAYSLVADITFRRPLAGDFEMVEVGVAVAAFTFLPYCQLTGSNVSADIFTQGAGPRTMACLSLLSGLFALAFGALLTWRMSLGLLDYRQFGETTAITGFPIWVAFVPIVISLAMLVVASLISMSDAFAIVRSGDNGAAGS